MIYVNQEQLDQVQYLIDQSVAGNHLLFDDLTVRRVLLELQRPRDKRVERAEDLLEQLILRPSISEKKAFLKALDPQTHDDVARVYFHIVQNKAQEKQLFRH